MSIADVEARRMTRIALNNTEQFLERLSFHLFPERAQGIALALHRGAKIRDPETGRRYHTVTFVAVCEQDETAAIVTSLLSDLGQQLG